MRKAVETEVVTDPGRLQCRNVAGNCGAMAFRLCRAAAKRGAYAVQQFWLRQMRQGGWQSG